MFCFIRRKQNVWHLPGASRMQSRECLLWLPASFLPFFLTQLVFMKAKQVPGHVLGAEVSRTCVFIHRCSTKAPGTSWPFCDCCSFREPLQSSFLSNNDCHVMSIYHALCLGPDFFAQPQPDKETGYLYQLLALQPGVIYYLTSQSLSFLICKMGR